MDVPFSAEFEKIDWPVWPQYGAAEVSAVSRVVRSNQLFAAGEVRGFEEQFAAYVGAKVAVGVGNATQGLHLALAASNVGAGDEVIVTPYSWISSASCILMQNAVPIFCDIEPVSLGLDPEKVEQAITSRTKAIIVVHMFGYPARVTELERIAARHGIVLIEDASHAHGASVGSRKVGCFGDISVFSLHQRKSLSVGDGGIISTNNIETAARIARLRSFGDESLSYNYRMSEFAAALGQVGLTKLDAENGARIENASNLSKGLSGCSDDIKIVNPRDGEKAVYFAVLLKLRKKISNLDLKLQHLQSLGIPIRKTWPLLHVHSHFNPRQAPPRGLPWLAPGYDGSMAGRTYSEVSLPVASSLCPENVLELYVHPPAGKKEIDFAANAIKSILLE